MPKDSPDNRFYCSFCEQSFEVTSAHIGRRINCPKCKHTVWVFPNRLESIDSRLASSWYYKKLRLLLGHNTIGPISGEEFLSLHAADRISEDAEVSSPEFTNGQWIELCRLNLESVKARVEQRAAERKRETKVRERRQQVLATNHERLRRAISSAIADGQVTFSDRNRLLEFAEKANIPASEVEALLDRESRQLLHDVIEDALEDGILEPHERQRIGELATGLSLQLDLTAEQNHRLHLCDLAYRLAAGEFSPKCDVVGVQLGPTETALSKARFEWLEIVQLKRADGIPLGGGRFLKHIASGECILTNKRVMMIGELAAKKFNLSSVAKATRFQDGVLFNRSTGKSVFLRPLKPRLECDEWTMLAVHAVTREPVQGVQPTKRFISAATPEADCDRSNVDESFGREPRYTFRVVGDHVDDRGFWIERLQLGSPMTLLREPHNPHDENAVAVIDGNAHKLGYVKRDVAMWFAPMLDRGRKFRCSAYRKPASGGLIVGVYETD